MNQKSLPLNFGDGDIRAIDEALAVLERKFAPLLALSPEEQQVLADMIAKSMELYHQALMMGALNPQIIPDQLRLSEDHGDLDSIDRLRSRIHRLRQLLDRLDEAIRLDA
jgi:hypothetical protein